MTMGTKTVCSCDADGTTCTLELLAQSRVVAWSEDDSTPPDPAGDTSGDAGDAIDTSIDARDTNEPDRVWVDQPPFDQTAEPPPIDCGCLTTPTSADLPSHHLPGLVVLLIATVFTLRRRP